MTNMYYSEAPWLQPRLARRRQRSRVERTRADRAHTRGPVRAADHRPAGLPCRELDRQAEHDDRQPGLRAAGRARDLSRRPQAAARQRSSQAGRGARRLRPGHRLAAVSRARAGRVQGQQSRRAAGTCAGPGRPADRHSFPRRRSGARDRAARLARRESVPDRPAPAAERRRRQALGAEARGSNSTRMPTSARCSATRCTRCLRRSVLRSAPRR